jgi:hypothetical protein
MRPILSGDTLDDRYELGELLGSGAFGKVFHARDAVSGRQVAVKVLVGASSAARATRFLREGEIVARLDHPGIVRVHAAGLRDETPYLVYELVEGARTLQAACEGASLPERVEWVREAAEALGYAHGRGVVHRDVKPENLLVDRAGRLRVADFGLALHGDAERLTQTGALVGTAAYLAPEKITGEAGRDEPTADVWSLGVVLYQALTGELPFPGDTLAELCAQIVSGEFVPPRELDPSLPRALERVVLRALASGPARRPRDGAALAAELAGWRERRQPGRGRAWAAVCLLGCASLVGGAVAWAVRPPTVELPQAVAPSPPALAPAPPMEPELPAAQGVSQGLALTQRIEDEGLVGGEGDASGLWVDGRRVVVQGGRAAALVDLESRMVVRRWDRPGSSLRLLSLLPDGSGCLVASIDAAWVARWDREGLVALGGLGVGKTLSVALALDPSGRCLLASGGKLAVRVRVLELGETPELGELVFEQAVEPGWREIRPVGFDPGARRLWAHVDGLSMLRFFDLVGGQAPDDIYMGSDVSSLAWDPASVRLAVGLRNGVVALRRGAEVHYFNDAAVGGDLGLIRAHVGGVRSLCFSLDGRLLFTLAHRSSGAGRLKLWSLEGTPRVVAERAFAGARPGHMSLSPEGEHLLISHEGATFEVIRVDSLTPR